MMLNMLRAAALPVLVLGLVACTDPGATLPVELPAEPRASTGHGAALLVCPAGAAGSVSRVVGAAGGVITLHDHRLVIPQDALVEPTEFTFTVPASSYVEVEVHANGAAHFQFERPVQLSLSYERCTRATTDRPGLRVFYIDAGTKQLLADMGGSNDQLSRRIVTTTDHLSGYAIGQN